jgi:hypothetical protein
MMTPRRLGSLRHARIAAAAILAACAAGTVGAFMGGGGGQVQIPTTPQDFFQPGTQPDATGEVVVPISSSQNCTFCHSDYSPTFAPFDTWVASMMGQSARDPIWHATLTIANQDAHGSGEFCIRCHAPGAWLGGRSSSGTLQDLTYEDYDGINCNFCHRAVNPVLGPDSAIGYNESSGGVTQDPTPDPEVLSPLAAAGLIPQGHGNARFIIDPNDVRRGPFSDVPQNFHGFSVSGDRVWLITSPFHSKSEFCGTCHDVSNPVFTKNAAGQYQLNALNTPHPTQLPGDMFPEQRTYSEWKNSTFATTGVTFADGRFGGALTGPMKSCQDCHMPDQVGGGCVFWDSGDPWFTRQNMPAHSFAGSNTWVIDAVVDQAGFDAEGLGLTPDRVQAAKARNIQMLRDASDMELTQAGANLNVRVINQSGHKLPSGYPEGRRMWLNVRFLNAQGNLVAERGAYNLGSATLSGSDTKVYEAKHGIDASVAAATGLPEGENFHLALANKKFKDNRIPPRGFTNAAFAADGCGPVNYSYADGQHWDDTSYGIPEGAVQAVVTLYYQTTSREYIEFLRDANVTDNTGLLAHQLWVTYGKSAPVDMDTATIQLAPAIVGDLNGDGTVNGADLGLLLAGWGAAGSTDLNGDGTTNGADLGLLLANWG